MASSTTSVITKARRINLAKITRGAVETIPPITHIAFGDAGVDAQGQPLQPSESQTELNHEIGRYAIDMVTNPPLGSADGTEEMGPDMEPPIRDTQGGTSMLGLALDDSGLRPLQVLETTNRYTVTIPESELNGKSISEMALIDEDGVFAAVKNFLPKGKDEDVTFTFVFDDEF